MKSYRLDKLEVPDLDRITPAIVRRAMPAIVEVVKDRARQLAPVSTKQHSNKLRDSIEGDVYDGGRRGEVAATAPHAHLVHDGTASHRITTRKRALAIYTRAAGHVLLRKGAYHPGSRAQPFLAEAGRQSGPDIARALQEAGDHAVTEALR